ncbi:uncharacterized protein I206_103219 [Kwoniella pini CBS 10737]|uniref:Uncharacterized protein n=1 Tax=Kwoniella pini CBS 10737 TaxID=1296096 RepID=A0A1B9IAA7_9TREE|nr:uncharacterized protein I206_01776 [Kwoniella pini CBS 10737]OCF52486.1 hypothetical protein I206_01776 [Kwoniella pini CBS 10737]
MFNTTVATIDSLASSSNNYLPSNVISTTRDVYESTNPIETKNSAPANKNSHTYYQDMQFDSKESENQFCGTELRKRNEIFKQVINDFKPLKEISLNDLSKISNEDKKNIKKWQDSYNELDKLEESQGPNCTCNHLSSLEKVWAKWAENKVEYPKEFQKDIQSYWHQGQLIKDWNDMTDIIVHQGRSIEWLRKVDTTDSQDSALVDNTNSFTYNPGMKFKNNQEKDEICGHELRRSNKAYEKFIKSFENLKDEDNFTNHKQTRTEEFVNWGVSIRELQEVMDSQGKVCNFPSHLDKVWQSWYEDREVCPIKFREDVKTHFEGQLPQDWRDMETHVAAHGTSIDELFPRKSCTSKCK